MATPAILYPSPDLLAKKRNFLERLQGCAVLEPRTKRTPDAMVEVYQKVSIAIQKPIPNRSVPKKLKEIQQEIPTSRAKPPIIKATHPDPESPSNKSLQQAREDYLSIRIPIRNYSSGNIESNPLFTPTVLFSVRCRCRRCPLHRNDATTTADLNKPYPELNKQRNQNLHEAVTYTTCLIFFIWSL
jgi:hypothetical protein